MVDSKIDHQWPGWTGLEPRASSWSPTWMQGSKHLGPFSTAFSRNINGLKPVPTWDAGVRVGTSTHLATPLTLQPQFLTISGTFTELPSEEQAGSAQIFTPSVWEGSSDATQHQTKPHVLYHPRRCRMMSREQQPHRTLHTVSAAGEPCYRQTPAAPGLPAVWT